METTIPSQFLYSAEDQKSSLFVVGKIFGVIGALLIIATFLPSISSRARETISEATVAERIGQTAERHYLPEIDRTLPLENQLIIPSIGVNTSVLESTLENYENVLEKGVWRVSDFGAPTTMGKPIILAAHRFGFLKWSNSYRRLNSFYNLPKLAEGDIIEVNWRQRKYIYAVYGESSGKEISDYSADLILYTCNDLMSDIRIFKYAKLLKV